jgi:hypothetical protein
MRYSNTLISYWLALLLCTACAPFVSDKPSAITDNTELKARARRIGNELMQERDVANQLHGMPAQQRVSTAIRDLNLMGPAAIPVILELADHPESPIRYWAIKKLSAFCLEGVPYFIEALHDKNNTVRVQAAWTINQLGPKAKSAVPALSEAMCDTEVDVRRVVIIALGKMGRDAAAAVPLLINALKSEDVTCKQLAARSLGMIGGVVQSRDSVIAALRIALRDPSRAVQRFAAQALQRIESGEDYAALILTRMREAETKDGFLKGRGRIAGLLWLARHQNPDGSWSANDFHMNCGKHRSDAYTGHCSGSGNMEFDVGVTSLALLAFTNASFTPYDKGIYDNICFGKVVKKGLQWLMTRQNAAGDNGRTGSMYNHAIATLALSEAAGLYPHTPDLLDTCQKSADYLIASQNPGLGWRYTMKSGDNDTSVTFWGIMALRSATRLGLSVPDTSTLGAVAWLDKMRDKTSGKVGYSAANAFSSSIDASYDRHETMAALALICRRAFEKDAHLSNPHEIENLFLADLPVWQDKAIDFCYWNHTISALGLYFRHDRIPWYLWKEVLREELILNQRTSADGCLSGSWDPVDRWSQAGCRVYATAINTVILCNCNIYMVECTDGIVCEYEPKPSW